MIAYYNEIDPYAAQWLRNLIEAGHIAPGYVDERSIEDVYPSDLRGFSQCHFFAGIGVWSHALRSSGWGDDRPVWTGSCPCQPFSAAGKGAGFDDERHLWPAFRHLISQCKPAIVFGEQVASKAVEPWIDLVQTDLEAMGYAFGCIPFPSAGVGAPHIRDRAYWVADSDESGREGRSGIQERSSKLLTWPCSVAIRLANNELQQRSDGQPEICNVNDASGRVKSTAAATGFCSDKQPGPVNGFWRDADWLGCLDDRWRPVEPGTFPLVNGAPSRVGRLRAYGNALNAEAARVFIEAAIESIQ